MATSTIDDRVRALVDAWCDRREYRYLRLILSGWPRSNGLTDDWALLMEALRSLRAERSLPEPEAREVEQLVIEVEHLVYRSQLPIASSGAREPPGISARRLVAM